MGSIRGAFERDPESGLYADVLARITETFGKHLSEVLRMHRELEVLTNETNVVGRQNLLEAFSHLAVLFARAPEMDRDEQAAQVAYLSDHLRRAMMEGFELIVYVTLARMWGEKSNVGRRYESHAAPLIKRHKLLGYVQPDEVRRRQDEVIERVTIARGAKLADGGWDAWIAAAQDLERAATDLRALEREMGAAVDAAEGAITARRRWILGLPLGAGTALLIKYLLQFLTLPGGSRNVHGFNRRNREQR